MISILLAALATLAITGTVLAQHANHGAPAPARPKTTQPAPPAATAPAATPAPAVAGQTDHSKMDHSKHATAASGGDAPSTAAFKAINDKMHAGMSIPFTGNADVDFIRGMIPHHEGAVEMAKVVLKHGKDKQTRKLAQDIIKAQQREIAMMKAWLAKNAK